MSTNDPSRSFRVVFALIMGFIMVGVVTLVTTTVNFGFKPGFMAYWAQTYLVGYCAAVPAIYLFAPIARSLTTKYLATRN